MKIFFDTETTGKAKNFNAPMSDVDNWPRLVQLGYIVFGDDGNTYSSEHIIRPVGFEIPVEASNIHGVTQEKALADGEQLEFVLTDFMLWLDKADTVIGHNVKFDINVVGAEHWRLTGKNPFEGKKIVDTMLSGTNFCQLPGAYGKYKWPKLHELYFKLFGREMGAAHTALQDIKNTSDCYFAMVERGIIK